MDNNLEIDKMITISTGHISKHTALALEREVKYCLNEIEIPLSIYIKAEFGWFIFIPDNSEFEEGRIPDDLTDCINFAKKHNCKWLCLDCDGLIMSELKTYDWN